MGAAGPGVHGIHDCRSRRGPRHRCRRGRLAPMLRGRAPMDRGRAADLRSGHHERAKPAGAVALSRLRVARRLVVRGRSGAQPK